MALVTQTFTSNTTWTVPTAVNIIDKVFVLSGGGGGGNNNGGGGGGGRVNYQENVSVTPGGSVVVTVGNGGAASANGGSSAFGGYSATGGSAGADNLGAGGSSNNAGGSASARTGGGGGGAGQAGKNGGDYPGVGGDGYYLDFTNTYYGGGGQGGSPATTQYDADIPAQSSRGGGAAGGGATNTNPANAGTNGLGGGGGGARNSGTGGAGGKGVVIIQYYQPDFELTSDKKGIEEGETITFTLRTRNIANGTSIPYTLTGTGITAGDFSGGLTGSFTISSVDNGANGIGTKAITLVSDNLTEGNEVVTLTLNGLGESITFTIADSSLTEFTRATDPVGEFVPGYQYTIVTAGNTDFTLLGSANNTPGTTFTATASGTVTAGSFVIGKTYIIKTVNLTDFTAIGASSNTVGVSFVATGIGSGGGLAVQGTGTARGPWISKTIETADYNNVQTAVANVLGTGSVDTGWGQVVQSSQITVSNKVTKEQYDLLANDIKGAWKHLYGSTPSLTTVSTSDRLRANTVNSPFKQYETYSNVLVARRLADPPVSQRVLNSHGTVTYTSAWKVYLTSTTLVSFSSSAKARHFFNSGGEIRFTSSRTGGATNTHNTTWTTLLTTAGTLAFGGAKPSQGTSPDDGTNFHKLTGTFQPWYEANASSPYADNEYRISARFVNASNPKDIEFKVEWVDDYFASGTALDQVDGTISLAVQSITASGFLEPVAIGNFEIETPTVSVGSISATGGVSATIVPNTTLITEGNTVTFTITTSNLANGTYNWEVFGMSPEDFSGGAVQGTVSITSGSGSFTRTVVADVVFEGKAESFYAEFRNGATTLARSSTITVAEMNVVPSPGYVLEGQSVTWTITGYNIPNGTYTYEITGGTTTDFTDGVKSGNVTVTSNSGSVTKTLASDADSGNETFYMDIKSGSNILARSGTITVSQSNAALFGTAAYRFTPTRNVTTGNVSAGRGMPGDYNSSVHGTVIWPQGGSWVGSIFEPTTTSITLQFSCDNIFSMWINQTLVVNNDTNWSDWNFVTLTVVPNDLIYISAQVQNTGGPYGFAGRIYNGSTTYYNTNTNWVGT